MSEISLTSTDSFTEIQLSYITGQEIKHYPLLVGAQLVEDGGISTAVLGSLIGIDDHEKAAVVDDIMAGMIMSGGVEQRTVRFPRWHKRLGRFVVGNRVYYTPANPEPI